MSSAQLVPPPPELQIVRSTDLQNIYSTLRKLEYFELIDLEAGGKRGPILPGLDVSLFPRKFVLKVLDERLQDLNDLAGEICTSLFKHIGGRPKRIGESVLELAQVKTELGEKNVRFADLDEYFHLSLHQLHDFFLDLDWHEADVEVLVKADSDYVASKLKSVKDLLRFLRSLNTYVQFSKVTSAKSTTSSIGRKSAISPKSPESTTVDGKRSLKSSLSTPKLDSPPARRRVRFKDAKSSSIKTGTTERKLAKDGQQRGRPAAISREDLRENHLLFAFNLLLFALNLFIQQLSNGLFNWIESSHIHEEIGETLRETKQKLRTNQLEALARRIKVSNDVYLTVLDYLTEIKEKYLMRNMSTILVAQEPERLYKLQKEPRIRIYIQRIGLDVESKILNRLAKQCLQVFLDLIVGELNLPPVELDTGTKSKSREEVAKGQDNIFNFVSSWLGVEEILFGFATPRNKSNERARVDVTKRDDKKKNKQKKVESSSLQATGVQMKSSSRILNQMDNLSEMIRVFLTSIAERLRNTQQITYFIRLMYVGFDETFDIMSAQLINQLPVDKTPDNSGSSNISVSSQIKQQDLAKHIDSIGAKIKCLKFIQIFGSTNKTILDIVEATKINLLVKREESIAYKLDRFTETCTKRTSSSFKI